MDRQASLSALPEPIAQTCDPEIEWYEDPQRVDAHVYVVTTACVRPGSDGSISGRVRH